jgi:DinB superfamily
VDRCEECGFVYDVAPTDLPGRLRSLGRRFSEAVGRADDAALRTRPDADTWSALEYTCHVRDVLFVQRDRLYVALVEEEPAWPPMYRDARPRLARYNQQDPATVVAQLQVAADLAAHAFGLLDAGQLARPLVYHYPERRDRTVLWLGQHTVHEGEHHLYDVHRVLAAVAR